MDWQEVRAAKYSRGMATEASTEAAPKTRSAMDGLIQTVVPDNSDIPSSSWFTPPVLVTVYRFPTMEPLRFQEYPANTLHLPLRKDILHRAVIYEGDATRQGTASTKWRYDVRGSNRKLRPQKGSGRARVGDKKSPIFRGGGVVFGPKPRDFSTSLQKKVYDLAWRTALSYRYRRGELVVVEENLDDKALAFPMKILDIFTRNGWAKSHGKSLLITEKHNERLSEAFTEARAAGRVLERSDVDVKDLLELGRVVIEKKALDKMIKEHSSDIKRKVATAVPRIA